MYPGCLGATKCKRTAEGKLTSDDQAVSDRKAETQVRKEEVELPRF